MITLCNLSARRDNRTVLFDINATVEKGDFVMIIGGNGSGKTTLLDVIAGRIPLNSGTLLCDNNDISKQNERERASIISRLFQNPSMNSVPGLTVRQNILLAAKKYEWITLRIPSSKLPDWIIHQLNLCGIATEELLDQAMHTLSGGQRQMIALVMATLRTPRILLLDEPTAALDPIAATKLLSFAHTLAQINTLTVLMVTHDQPLALALGNVLWVIENGTIQQKYGKEKKNFLIDQLIGNIDYERLKDR